MRTKTRRLGRRMALGALGALALALAAGGPAGVAAASQGGNIVAQAKPHLLVLSDLPKGWTAQGSVTNSTNTGAFPGAKQLAQCLGVSEAIINLNEPQASSPTFVNKAHTQYVQDDWGVFPSRSVARQELATFANTKVPSCLTTMMAPGGSLRQQIASGFGPKATLGTVTVTALNRSVLVPHSAGFRMSFPVTAQGVTLATSFDLVTMVRGKMGSQVFFSSFRQPFPASLERHLTAVAYGRT